jgi:hypothetical protein
MNRFFMSQIALLRSLMPYLRLGDGDKCQSSGQYQDCGLSEQLKCLKDASAATNWHAGGSCLN